MSDGLKTKRQCYLEKRLVAKQERNIEDIKELCKTPQGRRFIWRIIIMSGIYQVGFIENEKYMYYSEGKRELGKNVLNDLQASDQTMFAKMQSEHYSEEKSEAVMAEKFFKQDVEDGNEIDVSQ